MVRTKWRSTALKMALAGMCTALCIEGILQRGLAVPVYAEDTEGENYVGSTEWEEFIDYWHSSMNVAVDDLTGGAFDADDVARLNTATYAYASMLYQQYAQSLNADPNTGAIDYSVDVPAGGVYTGWYYRGNSPHSVTVFYYGSYGDPVTAYNNIPIVSADDFSIALVPNYPSTLAFPAFYTNISEGWRYYYNTTDSRFTFSSTSCSGIVSNANLSSIQVQLYTFTNSAVTLNDTSYSSTYFCNPYSPTSYVGGSLKDASGQPISNTRQQFIRAQVGNNFPDFLLNLKQGLDDNFPEEIVNDLWYDPTQGEPLPDVGTLDSLNFPPGLPSVEFNDVELPSEPLPQQAIQGVGFWFSIFTDMLDALGVKYIVITFLVIALVLAILRI